MWDGSAEDWSLRNRNCDRSIKRLVDGDAYCRIGCLIKSQG